MQNKKSNRQTYDYTTLIWIAIIAVICFAAQIIICKFASVDPILVSIITLIVYIAIVIVMTVTVYRYQKAKAAAEEQISSNSNALPDLLAQIGTAMVLTDGHGKIIWYNDKLADAFGIGNTAIGTSMYGFCELTEDKIVSGTSEKGGIDYYFNERTYNVTCFKIKAQLTGNDGVKEFYITVFDDVTETVALRDRLEKSLPAVAYIVVDNLEELAQYVKVSYRQATNEIETILKEWAGSLDAILREYDRDKYVMIFTREKLGECISDRFSILDKIRNVRLTDDESSFPVTVSIGIAVAAPSNDGREFDLTDVERDAAASLDMALQRGGDQVAIKTENGLEYFGGKTKGVQKRTRVKARVIANQLCTLISHSDKVLIMGHKNPDFDAVGACVGIARLATFCGVECRIISDASNENFRISTERLSTLEGYENMFVDAGQALDLITPSTLVIIVDANNFRIIEAPEVAANAKQIYIIDHHRQTGELPEYVINPPYIDPAASSACELVSEILEQCVPSGTLLKEEANVMLSGIMVDTKNFTRTTSTRTFSAALYLRGEGGNSEIARTFFNEEFSDYLAEAKFGGDVITYKNRIAITKSEGTGSPADRVAAAKAADKLLTIRGIDASFALVDIGGNVNISARSNGRINVQLILEKLGGGGHFDAAGAQVNGSKMNEAALMLKAAIDEYLDSSKQ